MSTMRLFRLWGLKKKEREREREKISNRQNFEEFSILLFIFLLSFSSFFPLRLLADVSSNLTVKVLCLKQAAPCINTFQIKIFTNLRNTLCCDVCEEIFHQIELELNLV